MSRRMPLLLIVVAVIVLGWRASFPISVTLSDKCLDSVLSAIFLKCPVVLAIHIVAHAIHDALVEWAQVVVIWLFLKLQPPTVINILSELLGVLSRQRLNSGLALLVFDAVILLVFVFASEALPRKLPFQEVKQDVADWFKVVTAGLLNANVRVYRSIPSCTSQGLMVTIWNMLACFWVSVAFGQAKVNHVNHGALIIKAH